MADFAVAMGGGQIKTGSAAARNASPSTIACWRSRPTWAPSPSSAHPSPERKRPPKGRGGNPPPPEAQHPHLFSFPSVTNRTGRPRTTFPVVDRDAIDGLSRHLRPSLAAAPSPSYQAGPGRGPRRPGDPPQPLPLRLKANGFRYQLRGAIDPDMSNVAESRIYEVNIDIHNLQNAPHNT